MVEVSGDTRTSGRSNPAAGADNGNLDILRSLAVLLVVSFHVEMFAIGKANVPQRPLDLWQLGHWGVLLFFVHTSFVLMLSLQRQIERTTASRSVFRPFMIRRAFRLLPLSIVTVGLVTLLRLPVADFPPHAMTARAPEVLANLLLVQNVTHHESAVATLWSLPYEMQMYLVLPLLFQTTERWRSLLPALVLWVAAAGLSWLALPRIGAWYDMPLYIPCFLSGLVAYHAVKSIPPVVSWRLWPLALLLVSIAYLAHPSVTSGWFLCLLVGLMIPLFSAWPDGLVRNAARLIARYSYGVYLAHFVCLWVAFYGLREPRLIQAAVFVILTVTTSVIGYHVIEAPLIAVGSRVALGPRDRLARSSTSGATAHGDTASG